MGMQVSFAHDTGLFAAGVKRDMRCFQHIAIADPLARKSPFMCPQPPLPQLEGE